jgi:DNA polymerase-3 subunit epsilon
MNDYSHFAIATEEVVTPASRARVGDWRLLRRLALPARLNDPQGGAIKCALVLDVETTGLVFALKLASIAACRPVTDSRTGRK